MAAARMAWYALAAMVGTAGTAHGQVPNKCLEIESILADACVDLDACPGATEGKNEMVRFITGPAAINIADLQFVFYSSTFRGIEQTSTTATLTAALNATIQSCGHLLEPPAGIIPPGSRVIFVTSTDMCVAANPFYALSDTLYIIFQKAGNSQGHFKNNDLVMQDTTSTPGPQLTRTLQINLPGINCGDTVAYDANRLINIYGNYGGQSEENDGATVNFAWPGQPVASYVNYGCQAPFEPTMVSMDPGDGIIDCGGHTYLEGSVSGGYTAVLWQGGTGVFSDPGALGTYYMPGSGDPGEVMLSFCAIDACGDTLCSQATFVIVGSGTVTVTTTDLDGCAPHCITFTAEAGAEDAFLWEFGDGATATGGEVSHCYTVSDGFYATLTVQQANGCADLVETIGPIGIEDCGGEVVLPTDTLVIPNVFTPNGDGLNDVFRVSGGGLTTLDVQIFNRWGQLVARLERVNQVWDGRSPTGEVLSDGTYFYTLQAQDGDGKTYDLSGTVTLRR
ncbi:MAG TPA: gliding motility-associated C-terminal domain-containing protein [Flavobacteriales bacterium]|nr:gliding motility-associated C-terminal domain-containing protein [Flavobacteriales bacterium]